jgi:hypothetical protein
LHNYTFCCIYISNYNILYLYLIKSLYLFYLLDNYENQLIWDSLSSEQKLSYQAEANKRNLENRYSEVKYIQNSEERLNVLKDGLRELKYQV